MPRSDHVLLGGEVHSLPAGVKVIAAAMTAALPPATLWLVFMG
jgi:hypothetical protein